MALLIGFMMSVSQESFAGRTKRDQGDDAGDAHKRSAKLRKVDDDSDLYTLCTLAREDDAAYQQLVEEVQTRGLHVLSRREDLQNARLFHAIFLKHTIACENNQENTDKAIRIFEELAGQGDPIAMYHLGIWCLNEIGAIYGPQTIATGYRWVRASLSAGYEKAIHPLADCLSKGYGCASTALNKGEAKDLRLVGEHNKGGIQKVLTKYTKLRAKSVNLKNGLRKFVEANEGKLLYDSVRQGVFPPEILCVESLFPAAHFKYGVTALQNTFFGITDSEYLPIIETLLGISEDQRVQRLDEMMPFHFFLKTGIERAVFLKVMPYLPESEWVYFSHFLTTMLPIKLDINVKSFLDCISANPLEDRMNLVLVALPYLRNLETWKDVSEMFTAVSKLTFEERMNLTTYDIYTLEKQPSAKKRKEKLKKILATNIMARGYIPFIFSAN